MASTSAPSEAIAVEASAPRARSPFAWYTSANARVRRVFWTCSAAWALDSMDALVYSFMIPTLMVAFATLVKGYGEAGDGFAAGVIAGLAFLMQFVAFGERHVRRALHTQYAPAVAVIVTVVDCETGTVVTVKVALL